MNEGALHEDKVRERVLLLKRYLYDHLEWEWPNEVKEKVSREIFGGQLPIRGKIDIRDLAWRISDGQIEAMINYRR